MVVKFAINTAAVQRTTPYAYRSFPNVNSLDITITITKDMMDTINSWYNNDVIYLSYILDNYYFDYSTYSKIAESDLEGLRSCIRSASPKSEFLKEYYPWLTYTFIGRKLYPTHIIGRSYDTDYQEIVNNLSNYTNRVSVLLYNELNGNTIALKQFSAKKHSIYYEYDPERWTPTNDKVDTALLSKILFKYDYPKCKLQEWQK
jgi:hypothetical protein